MTSKDPYHAAAVNNWPWSLCCVHIGKSFATADLTFHFTGDAPVPKKRKIRRKNVPMTEIAIQTSPGLKLNR